MGPLEVGRVMRPASELNSLLDTAGKVPVGFSSLSLTAMTAMEKSCMKVHFSSNIKDNIFFPSQVLNSDSQRANPRSPLGQESVYCLSAPNRLNFKK